MSRRSRVAALALLVLLVGSACMPSVEMGQGDRIAVWDYDMSGDRRYPRSEYTWGRRDWPVNLVFVGAANFDRVSTALQAAGGGQGKGSNMELPLKDAASWTRDLSVGEKDRGAWACTVANFSWRHARYYGTPGRKRMTNATHGDYVVATSHYDMDEHCGNAKFGWSEQAQARWARNLACSGYIVHHDALHLGNAAKGYRADREAGTYYQDSDGWATVIEIPVTAPKQRRCGNTW